MNYNVLLGAMIMTVLSLVASTTRLSSAKVIVKAVLLPRQTNATKQMLKLYPWIDNNWDLKETELYLVEEITQLCSDNTVSGLPLLPPQQKTERELDDYTRVFLNALVNSNHVNIDVVWFCLEMLLHLVEAGTRTDSPISSPTSPSTNDHDSVAPSSSSGTPGPQPRTSRTSGTSCAESSNAVNRPSRARKERKRATKRKIPEDGEDEEATSLRRSIESIEKQGEKLTEIMQGLQENQSKQLEMVASFMGSPVEAIKDKK
ncbi:hypothetical protein AWC38_SpisGene2552 [Stylophora pistillata]|uniref:Uncharacterized protein n=1 Tax=Stylophora pistillata TaxID=50429 RepID=A0A2B4STE8_STYPI|nr:hypothetical protein AWC38_SpisGene2552 [Stylophora pistillata]